MTPPLEPGVDPDGPPPESERTTSDLPSDRRRELHLSEALVLATGTGVALVAWASLVLANLGAHSLPGVLALAAGGLALAGLLVWRVAGRPPLVLDKGGLALIAGVGLLALVLSAPGFPYGIADKDPGVYVIHGQVIAREGSTTIDDEVAIEKLPARAYTPGARFPGIWFDPAAPEEIRPQFFYLYPALLATASDVGGTTALFNVNVLLAALAAMAVALAVRRAFGLPAGAIAGILLATNMLQVWQAKYPTTEVLAQVLLVVAVLAAAVSLETRWRPPALLAGLLLPLTFLARPDGLLLVLGALAGAAAIVAIGGWDRRIGWFLVGIAVAFPHAALQAWSWNRKYSDENDLPTPRTVLAVVVLLVLGVLVYRLVLRRPVQRAVGALQERYGTRRLEQAVGVLLAVGALSFLIFSWFREDLLGQDMLQYNDIRVRSYDEVNLERLTWYLTIPGLVLLWAGVLVLGLRRWRAVQWLVVLPMVALLPVYLWAARISPRLMWWGRRYVPSVLVGIVILIAIALAFAFAYRGRWWPVVTAAAAVAFAGLVGVYLSQSLPLRDHRELAGSYTVVDDLSALSGDQQGVYLWSYAEGTFSAGRDLGSVLWFAHDEISVLLAEKGQDRVLDLYREQYPDAPIFVITSGDDPAPPEIADRLRRVEQVEEILPFWEEDELTRPDEPGLYGVDFTVWELLPEPVPAD